MIYYKPLAGLLSASCPFREGLGDSVQTGRIAALD